MEILSRLFNFILNKLFPNRNKNESIVIKGNNNQPLSITKICDNNNGQININSTVDNSTTKNITHNEIIITDDTYHNKEYDWVVDISGYFILDEKICRYTAVDDGVVEITVKKDDIVTLINETKNCPGKSIELTDGTKTLKISCSKDDIIRLENKLNQEFHLISAKFYPIMPQKRK